MGTDYEKDLSDIQKTLNDLYDRMATHEGEAVIDTILDFIKEAKKIKKCSICGKIITGYGNNAYPVNDGICCNTCNLTFVIPKRLENAKNIK